MGEWSLAATLGRSARTAAKVGGRSALYPQFFHWVEQEQNVLRKQQQLQVSASSNRRGTTTAMAMTAVISYVSLVHHLRIINEGRNVQ